MRKNTIMKIIKNVVVLAVTLMVAIPLVIVIAMKISHYVPIEKVKGEGFIVSYEDKAYYARDRIYITVKSLMPDGHSYYIQLLKDGKMVQESGVRIMSSMKEDSAYFEDFGKGSYTVKVWSDYGGPAVKTKKIEFK